MVIKNSLLLHNPHHIHKHLPLDLSTLVSFNLNLQSPLLYDPL